MDVSPDAGRLPPPERITANARAYVEGAAGELLRIVSRRYGLDAGA
ncbi:hypothetical protein [Streptomyces bikiniensis]|nr:hypothetical protein [Streptomyces bikiniensis]